MQIAHMQNIISNFRPLLCLPSSPNGKSVGEEEEGVELRLLVSLALQSCCCDSLGALHGVEEEKTILPPYVPITTFCRHAVEVAVAINRNKKNRGEF